MSKDKDPYRSTPTDEPEPRPDPNRKRDITVVLCALGSSLFFAWATAPLMFFLLTVVSIVLTGLYVGLRDDGKAIHPLHWYGLVATYTLLAFTVFRIEYTDTCSWRAPVCVADVEENQ